MNPPTASSTTPRPTPSGNVGDTAKGLMVGVSLTLQTNVTLFCVFGGADHGALGFGPSAVTYGTCGILANLVFYGKDDNDPERNYLKPRVLYFFRVQMDAQRRLPGQNVLHSIRLHTKLIQLQSINVHSYKLDFTDSQNQSLAADCKNSMI